MVRPSAIFFYNLMTFLHLGRVNGSILFHCAQCRTFPKYRISGYGEIRQAGGNISFDPNIRSDLWRVKRC